MAIFQSKLIEKAAEIRAIYADLAHDHRPDMPPLDTSYASKKTEEFRRGYACFKHAVARVLQPKSICEIGVGSGIAALAFLSAAPDADYLGIDNKHDEREVGFPFIDNLKKIFTERNYKFDFKIIKDSRELRALPGKYDLVHVDACHLLNYAYHDTLIALRSGSPWILVDDARDSQVAFAVMRALYGEQAGSVEWAYFEDTWTGNILISREKRYGE